MPKILADAKVKKQEQLTDNIYVTILECPEIAKAAKPGNFLQVKTEKSRVLLRRPLGVANVENKDVTLIYRKIGKGTEELSELSLYDVVSLLGPLGNSFNEEFKNPLLIGGGLGLSPLLFYAKKHGGATVLIGDKSSEEASGWEYYFRDCAKKIFIATEDGSMGEKGFNVDLLPNILKKGEYDGIIACGPEPMMRKAVEIAKEYKLPVEVSLERRMGCGLGACLSCAIDTKSGRKKVCKDGPIFSGEEVFF